MWIKSSVDISQPDGSVVKVRFSMKQFETGSVFGINEGRISKLWMTIGNVQVANYDRGWDQLPTCEAAQKALEIILREYN